MRNILPVLLAAALSCSGGAAPAVERAVREIGSGRAPDSLESMAHPAIFDAISERLRSGSGWISPEDQRRCLLHLCANARQEDAEVLYPHLASPWPDVAYFVVAALSTLADDVLLKRVDKDLAEIRFGSAVPWLDLLALSPHPRARWVVARHAGHWMNSKMSTPATTQAVLRALGAHRIRSETGRILGLLEATADEEIETAAYRALGKIWETSRGISLDAGEEKERLSVLFLLHRMSRSAASTATICEAMLRVMTRTELEEFLARHAADRFAARENVAKAACETFLDPAKGRIVHEALLSTPDETLLSDLLLDSPHVLKPGTVVRFLEDGRAVVREGWQDLTIAECAAARFLKEDRGRDAVELPKPKPDRTALVEEARAARTKK